MKGKTSVTKLMTRAPATVHPTDTARQAQKAMQRLGVHHVPVVDEGRFVGLLSSNDLLRVAVGDPYRDDPAVLSDDLALITVQEVMMEDVVTIQQTATVRDAALKLASGSFHALPVLEGESLTGIVTTTDLIAFLVDD